MDEEYSKKLKSILKFLRPVFRFYYLCTGPFDLKVELTFWWYEDIKIV
jgi:hypothetical protein